MDIKMGTIRGMSRYSAEIVAELLKIPDGAMISGVEYHPKNHAVTFYYLGDGRESRELDDPCLIEPEEE